MKKREWPRFCFGSYGPKEDKGTRRVMTDYEGRQSHTNGGLLLLPFGLTLEGERDVNSK